MEGADLSDRHRFVATLLNAIPWLAGPAFAAIVAWHGIPALRQDWIWPRDRGDAFDLFVRSTSGWDPRGIGSPNLYVNDYLIGAALAGLTAVLGAHGALVVFMLAVGAACALGGGALATTLGAPPAGRAAVALFAVFNPWAYTETVAGHTYMLLAYGATMGLVAELFRSRPRPLVAALLALATLQQLQFFAVALLLVAIVGVRSRSWLPLLTALAVASPFIAGVALDLGSYRGVPYTLAWESSQSVEPLKALQLSGYFAGYASMIDYLDRWLMVALIAIALIGFALRRRAMPVLAIGLVTVACVAMACGLKGPLAGFERFAVNAIPAWAAFRELYDLLGFAAVGYAVGIACATAGSWPTRAAALAASAALALAWLIWSPWLWWMPSAGLPPVAVEAAPGTRYALAPAFQPLDFEGSGSGLDPDARIMPGDVDPLNVTTPVYPVDAALAHFMRDQSTDALSALGVSEVIVRPALSSDAAALAKQMPLPPVAGVAVSVRSVAVKPAPAVWLGFAPPVCTVCAHVGEGDVFFGDAAGLEGDGIPASWSSYRAVTTVRAPTTGVDAGAGWVDARLAFAADPDLAQAFGGALTTSSVAFPIDTSLGDEALVFVRGVLLSQNGDVLARSTNGYAWIETPRSVSAVRCSGLCVVAAQGDPPAGLAAEGPLALGVPAENARSWTPWLWSVDMPLGTPEMLCLNVAYDERWRALVDEGTATHLRIDAAVNGWFFGPRRTTQTVWLVQSAAAVQAVLELFGALWAIAVSFGALFSAARASRPASRVSAP
ncbi:MAG TPA: hypothetical protein VEJ20_03605 [Candidatus Eremiobacteraceae bacterium]|nr:hypothetical protein [Candidatus Eremiobacteraceae bacterium]